MERVIDQKRTQPRMMQSNLEYDALLALVSMRCHDMRDSSADPLTALEEVRSPKRRSILRDPDLERPGKRVRGDSYPISLTHPMIISPMNPMACRCLSTALQIRLI